eukprot:JP446910.1.p1 GENE.JP446910.1~~JP446910.1.p1  ORF type:complete len:215 (+),score=56.45 JP446910.1:39-683(+)
MILGYWKIRGLAQPARMMLEYAGIPFEDKMYEQGDGPEFSCASWLDVKPTLGLDFPNLPYLIDGDIKISQSGAIFRYIGRKAGLLGKSDMEMAKCDMMLEEAMDIRNRIVGAVYNPKYEEMKEGLSQFLNKKFAGIDGYLAKQPWMAGENVTAADFHMYELCDQARIMFPAILDTYPKITDFIKRFEALAPIAAYMASPRFMASPINNKIAQFK